MEARQVIGSVLITAVVLFTVYLSVVMLRRIGAVVLKDSYAEVFCYELAACAVFLLFALDVRFGLLTMMKPKALQALGWLVRSGVVALTAVLVFLAGRIIAGSFLRTDEGADNALVLGLALENGEPTPDLLARLDTAESWLRRNPEAALVLTGGNADASGRTEAAVMRDILVSRGAAAERLLLEDRAEGTRENFRNAAAIIDPAQPVVLITSGCHMDRAVRIARAAGFQHVLRLPAPSSFASFGANVMWEVLLELNELTLKK